MGKIKLNCHECYKEFSVWPSALKYHNPKYCSLECSKSKKNEWKNANEKKTLELMRKRFERFVITNGPDDCWGWKGAINESGYGILRCGPILKNMRASRVSWLIHKGNIPDGLYCLHTCDSPICSNVNHLFLGTQKDNMNDMLKKGRRKTSRGEEAGRAKLTDKQVIEIWESDLGSRKLSKIYKVGRTAIKNIKDGVAWKHLKLSKKKRNNILQGEKCSGSKLKQINVIEIINQLKINSSKKVIKELSEKYKVSKTTIYDIKSNRTWKHIHIKHP